MCHCENDSMDGGGRALSGTKAEQSDEAIPHPNAGDHHAALAMTNFRINQRFPKE
jgi:hypothetical protein